MKVKISFLAVLLLMATTVLTQQKNQKPVYKNPQKSDEERVEDLLNRMTLDEKLAEIQFINSKNAKELDKHQIGTMFALLRGNEAGVAAEKYNKVQKEHIEGNRLGIPILMMDEALFGYMGYKTTSFPQPIGLASSWNPDLVNKAMRIVAIESKARGCRNVLCPVVNLPRDIRWGRFHETFGEDPYLASQIAIPYVKAFEEENIITCPKHFVANMGLDGRFGGPVHFTERLLREKYFPAFKACFQEGGAKMVMMAYNTLDGTPCTMNEWLMKDILKNEWGFDGIIVSDGGGITIADKTHKVGENDKELAARALNAGCDMDLSPDRYYGKPLKEAVEEGLVAEKNIDEAVRRVLRQKFRVGLFDEPFVDPEHAAKITDCDEHRKIAYEVARECVILLKNEKNTLPFSKNVNSVAILGPLADELYGTFYAGYGRKEVTLLDGIRDLLPNAEIVYEKGAELYNYALPPVQADYLMTNNGQGGLIGEYFDNKDFEGEPVFTRVDEKIEFDWKTNAPEGLPADHFSIRWTGKLVAPVSGKVNLGVSCDDGVRVYVDNQMIIDDWSGGSKHLVQEEIELEKGKQYDLKIEYYDGTDKAIVQFGWDVFPFSQVPEAVEAAKNADVSVIVVGSLSAENRDRAILDLSESQEKLINSVAALGKPMAVVLHTGNVITMLDWEKNVPAIIESWYPGEEGGRAVAEVLFGDVNPSAKLPSTFPKHQGQVPLNYNHLPKKTSAFIGIGNDPLFPFGHGLSYTTFEYNNLNLSSERISEDETLKISLSLKNSGQREGAEVVQLYLHDKRASMARPVKELKRFKKIWLKPDEEKTVEFELTREDLEFLDINMKKVVEPGEFSLMIGSSSEDIRLEKIFEVVK